MGHLQNPYVYYLRYFLHLEMIGISVCMYIYVYMYKYIYIYIYILMVNGFCESVKTSFLFFILTNNLRS